MLVILCCVAICQSEKPVSKKIETAQKAVTPLEFCQLAYERRVNAIKAVQNDLDNIPKKNDWGKLSPEAKRKLEKPFKDKLAALKADKAIDWNIRSLEDATEFEVFRLPRTGKKLANNDQFEVEAAIDRNSVLAVRWLKELPKPIPSYAIIAGMKPGEFLDKKHSTLKLTGMWQRVEPLKFEGKTYARITRWPHEEAVKAAWPKFLKEKEKAESAQK